MQKRISPKKLSDNNKHFKYEETKGNAKELIMRKVVRNPRFIIILLFMDYKSADRVR